MRQFLFTLLLISMLGYSGDAQTNLKSKLSHLYGHLAKEQKPGLSISIIENGKVILSEGFGMANVEHLIPFSPNTISDLGSVSKQLTAFAIIMLHDEGVISLDEDIRTYLPDLPDLGYKVTARHLIHHTSGIPDVYALHGLKGMRAGDHINQQDAIIFLKRRPAVDYPPGSQYRYTNTGYMLLAEIVKEVTGSGFEEWMQQNIFIPLNMRFTGIMDIQGEIFPNMADGYVLNPAEKYIKIYDNSTLQGGGGVYSSGNDMLRWIDNFRTRKLGNNNIWGIFLQPATLNNGEKIEYAGGINVNVYRGITRYTHNGSSAGYRTKMAYYPDYQLGFMIKSNTPQIGYDQFEEIEDIILESTIGEELLEKKEKEEKEIQKTGTISDASTIDYDDYTGHYYSKKLDFTLEVVKSENGLVLKSFFYDFPPTTVMEPDLFKSNGTEIKFLRNKDGEIVSINISTPRASNLIFTRQLYNSTK